MSENPFAYNQAETPKKFSSKKIVDIIQIIVMFVAVGVVVYLFFMIPTQVDGVSMFPTLKNNEILFANRFIQIAGGKNGLIKSYDYGRGDIIVFKKENHPDLVKRIIGMPGDTVEIKDGKIYINGQVLDESEYLDASVSTGNGTFLQASEVKTVPPNSYFVVGDNRPNSKDSRSLDVGFVKREEMKGRNFVRLVPFTIIKHAKYPNNPELK